MKTTKFLIVMGDSEYILDGNLKDELLAKRIIYNEEPRLKVIECKHEEFEDNLVELEDIDDCGGFTFLKDIRGNLWYFTDHMTQVDVINAWERNGN